MTDYILRFFCNFYSCPQQIFTEIGRSCMKAYTSVGQDRLGNRGEPDIVITVLKEGSKGDCGSSRDLQSPGTYISPYSHMFPCPSPSKFSRSSPS